MKINFHNLKVYNPYYSVIGAVLLLTSHYLDINKKAIGLVVWPLITSAGFFFLMAFRKPKHLKEDDQS